MIEDMNKSREEGSRTLCVPEQHGCGVSQAWWPADMRRSQAIGKAAQRRRTLMMQHMHTMYAWQRWQRISLPASLTHRYFFSLIIVGVGGILTVSLLPIAFLLLLHQYMIMIGIFAFCGLVVLFTRSLIRDAGSRFWLRLTLRLTPGARKKKMRYTPETPLPGTPLVRVLETIDLSSSDVEHFLDTPLGTSSHVSMMGELTQ